MIIDNTNESPAKYIRGYFPPVYCFEAPNIKEMDNIITELRNSAQGHDEISASFVKEVKGSILKPLLHISAVSMETGLVLSGLKLGKVIPLFKSGDMDISHIIVPSQFFHVFPKS